MNEKELRKFIGKKVRYYRNEKGLTQKELGKIIGVENNSISAYERGAASLGQDLLFKLGDALDISVDDLFPPKENTTNELERALKMADGFNEKDIESLNILIEKALSMSDEERAKFLDSMRFAIEHQERMIKWWGWYLSTFPISDWIILTSISNSSLVK